jgi:PAS domain S-box-containing protein
MTHIEDSPGTDGPSGRFHPLFELANDAIALVEFTNGSPIIEEVNPRFRETFAPDDTNLLGMDLDEVVAPRDRREAARELSQLAQNGEVLRKTITRDTAAGSRHFDLQVIPVDAATIGDAGRVFAVYTDVTDRFERKQALEESEERYRQLVATAPTPILIYGGSEKVVYANDAAVELFGAESEEDLLGLTPQDFVHPDSRDELDDRRHRLIDEKEAVPPNELTLLDRHGREKTVLVASSPVTYDGEPAIQTVATDITELKDRERQLERYETLVEVSGDPMYMLDEGGRFTYVNEALVEISGQSRASLIGEPVRTVMDTEHVERGEELISSLLSAGERRGTFEMELVTATGDRIPAENHISLLYAAGDFNGTVGVLRDITDRLERERQLQRERDRLDEFAGVLSHDLRNPLNVAAGRLALAMEECESEHLESVDRAHHRMEQLVNDVLSLARAGDAIGETDPVALAEFIEACWRNVDTDSAELSIETDVTLLADKTRLQQLLENLIRNAVEHGGSTVTITVGDVRDGFFIEDDGPGIPEVERDRVLDPGYSTREGGTGFGLSIVRDIAEAHGWEIAVTEGHDGGARFEFTGAHIV